MNEEQIERIVERMTDAADERLMSGAKTQAEYDLRMKDIDAWAVRERECASYRTACEEIGSFVKTATYVAGWRAYGAQTPLLDNPHTDKVFHDWYGWRAGWYDCEYRAMSACVNAD